MKFISYLVMLMGWLASGVIMTFGTLFLMEGIDFTPLGKALLIPMCALSGWTLCIVYQYFSALEKVAFKVSSTCKK